MRGPSTLTDESGGPRCHITDEANVEVACFVTVWRMFRLCDCFVRCDGPSFDASGTHEAAGVVDHVGLEHPAPTPHGSNRLGPEHTTQRHQDRVTATGVHAHESGSARQFVATDHPPLGLEKDLENGHFLGVQRRAGVEEGVGGGVHGAKVENARIGSVGNV